MAALGRPPVVEGEHVQREFALPRELDDALSAFAAGVGWSRSAVVRRLLRDALDGIGLISPEVRDALVATRYTNKKE